MDTKHSHRTHDLFAAALGRPREERIRFLDKTCVGEPKLRSEVEALLAADGEIRHATGSGPALAGTGDLPLRDRARAAAARVRHRRAAAAAEARGR